MNTSQLRFALFLSLASPAFGQGGPLTPPPGPPGPVMKTLDQIEARTPLVAGAPGVTVNASGTIFISQRGSYYLTDNVVITTAAANGIVISVSNVTLDLNGFALVCTSVNGGSAISLGSSSNVAIRNGSITGGTTVAGSTFTKNGWENGVNTSDTTRPNVRVSDLMVQGVREKGIYCPFAGSSVDRCAVNICGNIGINACHVSGSSVRNAGATAIHCPAGSDGGSVDRCFGQCIGGAGQGINAPDGSVSNSKGIATGGEGIFAQQVSNSHGTSVSEPGLRAQTADNCTGNSQSNPGIWVTTGSNCIGTSVSGFGFLGSSANYCTGITTSGTGLAVTGAASFCRGVHGGGGTALTADIAIGCTAYNGTIYGQKHLGTP